MKESTQKLVYAAAAQLGFIIGVGIFSVPFIVAQAGFAVGMFWIALLGTVLAVVNIFYSEVVSGVSGKHRLPGYALRLLGPHAQKLAFVTNILGSWCAIIAYAIVGGEFCFSLLAPTLGGTVFWYIVVFGFAGALIIGRGMKLLERTEFIMTALLVGVMLLIIASGLGESSWLNIADGWQMKNFFAPYGIILFALGGAGAVPVMHEMVGGNKKQLRLAIVIGSFAATVLTALFAIAVVGATGPATTPEALQGLSKVVGEWVVGIGHMFGLLAIITSYLVLGLNLDEVFRFDLKVPRPLAWLLAFGVPMTVFLLGARNFVRVIDFSGTVFGSIESGLIVLLFLALIVKQKKRLASRRTLQIISVLLLLVFAAGFFAKIIQPLFR